MCVWGGDVEEEGKDSENVKHSDCIDISIGSIGPKFIVNRA